MFISTFVVQALLAAATFANPTAKVRDTSSDAADALTLPVVNIGHINRAAPPAHVTTPNAAGAALISSSQDTFVGVTAQFSVPPVRAPAGAPSLSAVFAWVGIDAVGLSPNAVQTGIQAVVRDGRTSFEGWYRWVPGPIQFVPNVSFSPNNEVRFSIRATSRTSAIITIDNISTGEVAVLHVEGPALLRGDAEWIVQAANDVPLASFGDFAFTLAGATLANGTVVGPLSHGATILNIEQNGRLLTETALGGSSVTVRDARQ